MKLQVSCKMVASCEERRMKLIDADALIEDVRKNSTSYFADDFAHEWVDKQPTVDAVSVRHGKWNCGDDMFEYAICSACKWDSGEAWEYAKKNFIYCPNCGARMDEADDERNR